ILLGSWLILNTINPSFLQLREPEVYPVPLSVSMFQGGNSLFSPILLCKQSVSNINSVLSTSTPSETLLEIKKDIEEKCYSLRGVGGIIEDEEWRKPDERWTYSRIIYIFPGNYGNHHGVILLAEDQKGQVIYNLTENIKVARPMEGEIPTAIPFTMVKEGITSFRDYIREVQLYRFVGMEGNPQNPKQDDDDYNDIYGPYYSNSIMVSTSTSPGIAAVEISLIRDTTSGEEEEEEEEEDPVSELRLRSMDFSYYIVENLSQRCAGGSESGEKCDLNLKKPTIAIFYVCRDDIPWEDGRSCRIAVFNENNSNLNQTDMKDFCYYHVDFPCAGGMFIIAGSIGIF
ncbi:MAG: hypothetical protein PHV26_03440, partial [Candidatus Pacebacteria bacterium]|nr:hypothetical protein [Candidatus Paceibacterota bacterium]